MFVNKISKLMIVASVILIALAGCTSKNEDAFVPVKDLTVAPDFDWTTTQHVEVDLAVNNNVSMPVPSVVFELFVARPDANSSPIAKGATNASGKLLTSLTLPSNAKSVWARGFMSTIEIPIVNGKAVHQIGGEVAKATGDFKIPDDKAWKYLPGMSYNNDGAPSPITNVPLDPAFLARVSQALPEGAPLTTSHPEYLIDTNQLNIHITELADVSITFVHEDAGYKNSLGFITYNTNNPPTRTNQIRDHIVLLPNASLVGSGGSLQSGNTIELGRYAAGKSISWFLVADGFNKNRNPKVDTTKPIYYSLSHLNPESPASKKQHAVQLFDIPTEKFVIGFEDINRQTGSSDNDFNDLIFYVTVTPVSAVDDMEHIPTIGVLDTDGDGIPDEQDDYPNDPDLAFNNYTYGENGWGTLAFEDLWPNMGDYDFNDMIMDYNYNQITNAENKVKKVEMRFKLRAVGANYNNGFAVQTPFDSANLHSFTATHPDLFEHELGSKAVMRMFMGSFDLIPKPAHFINTEIDKPFIQPEEFSVSFKLQNAIPLIDVESAPYNPFIFVNRVRSAEIHLPGFAPTDRMDMTLFGTGDDASSPGNWYKAKDSNLPWAVNIPVSWDYPVEHAQITKPYLKFKDWVESSGNSHSDWYTNKAGYRNPDFIYQAP